MAPIFALLIIAVLSILLIRIGSTALVLTGVSRDAAVFQANSAFFGVGFTTRESELVVNHPVRRRIILGLIISGNLGVTSVLATVLASIVTTANDPKRYWSDLLIDLGIVALALIAFAMVWRLGFVQRGVDWSIRMTLERTGVVRSLDYELLLRVEHGYGVTEVEVEGESRMAGHDLASTRLRDAGVVVLGIERESGEYIGVPKGTHKILKGDVLTVYGRDEDVRRAFAVEAGSAAPAAAAGTVGTTDGDRSRDNSPTQ